MRHTLTFITTLLFAIVPPRTAELIAPDPLRGAKGGYNEGGNGAGGKLKAKQ
jgi:hypothetical protein